jgi:hypothetical protein
MLGGTTFSGPDVAIHIAATGPATEGGESPPGPAILTLQSAQGDATERGGGVDLWSLIGVV